MIGALDQGIAQRDHLGFLPIAAQRVAKAHLAGRKPHRRARHRGLAQVERRAVAASAATHHHEAILRLAQIFMIRQRDRGETPCDLAGAGMRQHRHRCFSLGLLATLFGRQHQGRLGFNNLA